MNKTITAALVGLGGYGNTYLEQFFSSGLFKNITLIAGADPDPATCNFLPQLKDADIPVYKSIDDLYQKIKPDLLIISAPIHLHAPMTCRALAEGSHVMCEKPLAATIADVREMIKAEKDSDHKRVAVGYQWSYSPAVIALKKDIISGRFGMPKRMRTITLWPRKSSYYSRAAWAGRKHCRGAVVYDSPVSNATAHYLHNMLYLLGTMEHTSAIPVSVSSEVYRAKDIENFDTAAIRCLIDGETEVLFYTTHSCPNTIGPKMCFEFEHAEVSYDEQQESSFIVRFKNGGTEKYGSPHDAPESKIMLTADAIRNNSIFRCGITAATPHVQIVHALQESHPEIPVFPQNSIVHTPDQDSLVYVKDTL